MDGIGRVKAELTFLPKSVGGRSYPPVAPGSESGDGGYMPHLVIEGSTEYLGVRFIGGPQPIFGEPAQFDLLLMYPGVDFSGLLPGVPVTVREGGRIVARGRVLEGSP